MNINQYKVLEIRSSKGIYKLSHPAEIIDEGSFYRIDGTYIYDKHKIKSIEIDHDKVTIRMSDDTVVLTVTKR